MGQDAVNIWSNRQAAVSFQLVGSEIYAATKIAAEMLGLRSLLQGYGSDVVVPMTPVGGCRGCAGLGEQTGARRSESFVHQAYLDTGGREGESGCDFCAA